MKPYQLLSDRSWRKAPFGYDVRRESLPLAGTSLNFPMIDWREISIYLECRARTMCAPGDQRKSRSNQCNLGRAESSGVSPGYRAPCSAECERKRFHARVEELDLELSISHGFWLSY